MHGPATEANDDRLVIKSFNHDAMALARQVAFVPAFDPGGPVRRGTIAMRDLVAAGRPAGVTGILRDDPVPTAVVPVTPADPALPDDLLIQLADGGVSLQRAAITASVRPRFAYEAGRGDDWRIVSAITSGTDGVAWLEEDSSGNARVLHLGTSPVPAVAFEMEAPPTAELYPANLDALAVGPRGELAIVRSPSGGEPPSGNRSRCAAGRRCAGGAARALVDPHRGRRSGLQGGRGGLEGHAPDDRAVASTEQRG